MVSKSWPPPGNNSWPVGENTIYSVLWKHWGSMPVIWQVSSSVSGAHSVTMMSVKSTGLVGGFFFILYRPFSSSDLDCGRLSQSSSPWRNESQRLSHTFFLSPPPPLFSSSFAQEGKMVPIMPSFHVVGRFCCVVSWSWTKSRLGSQHRTPDCED